MLVSKEELEGIKKEHQDHLLNTKYLRSHIMLVSKEDLERLRKYTMNTFKGQRGNISCLGNNDL